MAQEKEERKKRRRKEGRKIMLGGADEKM